MPMQGMCTFKGLRNVVIFMALLNWLCGFFAVYMLVQFHTDGVPREFRFLWSQMGGLAIHFVPHLLLYSEAIGNFLIGIFLLIGACVWSTWALVIAAILQSVLLLQCIIVCCISHYYHHMLLAYRGTTIFSLYTWARAISLFFNTSLLSKTIHDNQVNHILYARDSFVIPVRRKVFNATTDLMEHPGTTKSPHKEQTE